MLLPYLLDIGMGGGGAIQAYIPPNISPSGTSFTQFQVGGATGHLERLIAAQTATLAPTVAHTWASSGGGSAGGLLTAGTYYSVVTETNGIGETTPGPQSTPITVSTGNQPQITFAALQPGNTVRNVYLGAPGGPSGGPYTLYASGITALSYTLSLAAPVNSSAVNPPTVNTTGLTFSDANGNTRNRSLEFLREFERKVPPKVYAMLRQVIDEFNGGEPMSWSGTLHAIRDSHTALALLAAWCNEVGTIVSANPGTFNSAPTGVGGRRPVRTWP